MDRMELHQMTKHLNAIVFLHVLWAIGSSAQPTSKPAARTDQELIVSAVKLGLDAYQANDEKAMRTKKKCQPPLS